MTHIIKLTKHAFLLMMSDDVHNLGYHPGRQPHGCKLEDYESQPIFSSERCSFEDIICQDKYLMHVRAKCSEQKILTDQP